MTGLCFTFTNCNVLLGLVCVRVSGLGSSLHSVKNVEDGRKVVGKLAIHGALVGNIRGLMMKNHKWRRQWS